MRAECKLFLSQKMQTTLLEEQELAGLDSITLKHFNESDFRINSIYRPQIDSFLIGMRNYCQSISDPKKRSGKIVFEYTGLDGNQYFLNPLYGEDLLNLGIKTYQEETFQKDFFRKTKNKVLATLKKKETFSVGTFFQDFSFLFASTYYKRQGYSSWVTDLKEGKNLENSKENLLKVFRKEMTFPKDERDFSRFYFRARVIYDYAKENGMIEFTSKKTVKNLQVHQIVAEKEEAILSKKQVVGTSNFALKPEIQEERREKSYDDFLERCVQVYQGKRVRMADLHLEYMERIGKSR